MIPRTHTKKPRLEGMCLFSQQGQADPLGLAG